MGRIYLTIFIATIYLSSFGQKKTHGRSIRISEKLVGSWKFDYALYGASMVGMRFADTSKIFHTDTIHFFKNLTFKFRSHDTEYNDIRIHTGTWEITDKGRTLIHKERVAEPPFDGQSPDLTFLFDS